VCVREFGVGFSCYLTCLSVGSSVGGGGCSVFV
jgi:hypothetical protein